MKEFELIFGAPVPIQMVELDSVMQYHNGCGCTFLVVRKQTDSTTRLEAIPNNNRLSLTLRCVEHCGNESCINKVGELYGAMYQEGSKTLVVMS